MMINLRPYRSIMDRFGLSKGSLIRHHDDHLPETMARAKDAEDVRHAIDVVGQFKAINGACIQVLADARRAGDGELVLKACDRVQRQLELQLKVLGQLDERPVVNILMAPEWLLVRSTLLDALRPYPEARVAVTGSLMALGSA